MISKRRLEALEDKMLPEIEKKQKGVEEMESCTTTDFNVKRITQIAKQLNDTKPDGKLSTMNSLINVIADMNELRDDLSSQYDEIRDQSTPDNECFNCGKVVKKNIRFHLFNTKPAKDVSFEQASFCSLECLTQATEGLFRDNGCLTNNYCS